MTGGQRSVHFPKTEDRRSTGDLAAAAASQVPAITGAGAAPDRLSTFWQMRSELDHLKDLWKILETGQGTDHAAPSFANAARRLAETAAKFSEMK